MSDKKGLVVVEKLPTHIKKGHQLVFSRQDLSAREADIFALMIAHMKPEDWQGSTPPCYEFPAQQLSQWLKISSKHVGYTLDPVAERLTNKSIGIKNDTANGDREFDYIPLFKRIVYRNRCLTIIPNDELRAEYIEYKQGFALINTSNYLSLKKEYSKRLYELLSRFKSEGTVIRPQKIDDLKGLFGLLDVRGKIKSDKTTFENNSVFISRCVRTAIEELNKNADTKKELLFYTGEQGRLGYDLVKKGRNIIAVKFLYKWLVNSTVEELNDQDAKETIHRLEIKRLQTKQALDIEELKLLASAYRMIERFDRVDAIEAAILERETRNSESDELENTLDNMLDKIDQLIDINNAQEY